MKVTKRPKRVSVRHREITRTIAEYTCPTCNVQFVGNGPMKNVIRFVCDCGQELIVNREANDELWRVVGNIAK